MVVLTAMEAKGSPLACIMYNMLEDLCSYLRAGMSKTTFGEQTDHSLSQLSVEKKRKHIKYFLTVFDVSVSKVGASPRPTSCL